MAKLELLEAKLNYKFKDQKLLIYALTHKSAKKNYNNERLEFLGDAVLRAALVNEKSFAKIATSLNLGDFIFMSIAEQNNGGKTKPSILSDAFEALIGALHLEAGFIKAKEIALRLIEENFPNIDAKSLFKDYKTKLQEITQAKMGLTPEYETLRAFGPDHQKSFEIALNLEGKEMARAIASSKKEAQQMAAKLTLEKLGAL